MKVVNVLAMRGGWILDMSPAVAEQHMVDSTGPINRPRGGVLAEQVDLFRLLIESIREYAIFVLDPEGNVLTWNPGAQAMKG